MSRGAAVTALAVLGAVVAACSGTTFQPGTADAPRTVTVSAFDSFAFSPETIPVRAGEVVRFVVSNEGQLEHEFVIGRREELLEHAGVMTHGGMRTDTAYAIRLIPGQTKELVYTFGSSVDLEFGCMVPGHYPAGMAGRFEIIR